MGHIDEVRWLFGVNDPTPEQIKAYDLLLEVEGWNQLVDLDDPEEVERMEEEREELRRRAIRLLENYEATHYAYVGEPMLTRGDYGVAVRGGHRYDKDDPHIYAFDPDVGDVVVGYWDDIDNWVPVPIEEWNRL